MLKAMAASLYIVVEGEDPGFNIFVNGHALARNEDALERLAERLSVRPLLDYFSADRNSMALLLEHGAGNPEWTENLPQAQWFAPEEALRTVRGLLDFLSMSPVALGSDTELVVRELHEYEVVLASGPVLRVQTHPSQQFKVGEQVAVADREEFGFRFRPAHVVEKRARGIDALTDEVQILLHLLHLRRLANFRRLDRGVKLPDVLTPVKIPHSKFEGVEFFIAVFLVFAGLSFLPAFPLPFSGLNSCF